jgi:hypothetical protein
LYEADELAPLGSGQGDGEFGSLARRCAQLDLAAMAGDDAMHHRETETAAAIGLARREERLEDTLREDLLHAAAVIGNGETHKPRALIRRAGNLIEADGDLADAIADRLLRIGY